jgi:predicted PurR-regulated permease PerM
VWGVPGAILAVPMMVTLKIVADRVPSLRPLGEFLGP